MTIPSAEIRLPRRPEPRQPHSFPLIAVLAPVAGSLAMWAIVRSPHVLLFAVLGPIVALGSLLDSRIQGRRHARRERARFTADVEAARSHIEAEKQRVREELDRSVRSAAELIAAPRHDPERWRYPGGPLLVALGRGTVDSGMRVAEGHPETPPGARGAGDAAIETALQQLRVDASTLDDAPVIVDARYGIGVCGAPVVAESLARGLVVQLAAALSPESVELRIGEDSDSWARSLPQYRGGNADAARVEFIGGGGRQRDGERGVGDAGETGPVLRDRGGPSGSGRVVVMVTERPEHLPRDCRLVLGVSGGEIVVLRHPPVSGAAAKPPRSLRAQFVSRLDAERFATTLAEVAHEEGLGVRARQPPQEARLATLAAGAPPSPGPGSSRSLAATFAVDFSAPVTIDLVADGPHAVVGGTTGSGKSELLISWVLAMATRHPPERVTFLLVDFKGGSSFAAVQALAHCVGLITDLDQPSARRALESLRAELRHRERRLAESGARSIDELGDADPAGGGADPLPRLVVVVDEFAAMIGYFPELHALFSDIASRGRSLGVHLILCTQRPAGALRDSVMANCTLRLSLRVNNAADSTAVIGSPDAAGLPAQPLGRCYLSVAGSEPRMLQVALSAPADSARVAGLWAGSRAPRRPWREPLPPRVALEDLHRWASRGRPAPDARQRDDIPFGLLDVPEEQRQSVCAWCPPHGHLLVLGGQGSGKSTLLGTLARSAGDGAAVRLPPDVEGAWDMLAQASAGAGLAGGASILLIDDVDALVSRFPETHQLLVTERLAGLLRDGPGRGIRVAITAQRLTALVHSLASLCDSRLLLRLPIRQDHVMAGGDGTDHDARLAPGAGWWHGHRVQVAWTPPVEPAAAMRRRAFDPGESRGVVVVSTRPQSFAAKLREACPLAAVTAPGKVPSHPSPPGVTVEGAAVTVAVADPQAWQSQWGVLSSMRSRFPMLFDRCTAAEFRAISGSAVMPPPLSREAGGAWLLGGDGRIERVQLPEGF